MKIKIKTGEKITISEFFKRWKEGINKVTPFEMAKISMVGIILVLIGSVYGWIVSLIFEMYWLLIILTGSVFLSVVSLIGGLQKYWTLKKVDEFLKGEDKENG